MMGRWNSTFDKRKKATAEKLYDEMDFQRATQAFIWALPAVGFHALHLAHLNRSFNFPIFQPCLRHSCAGSRASLD